MLSVLMPVKNEALHIADALASVAMIETIDFEVIVVDDGSDDETCQLVKELNYPFVRLVETGGVGKARAFSIAYEQASGHVFVLLAGDDLLVANSIHARLKPILLSQEEEPCISFCKLESFSSEKKYDGMVLPKHIDLGLESGGCMAFNKAFAELAFPIPAALPNEDVWLMLHARYSPVLVNHVPVIGLMYRIHSNNSYKRGVDYDVVNEQMWSRQRAHFYFYEERRKYMNVSQQRVLLLMFLLHLMRYLGCSFFILALPGSPIRERIKLFFNSSRFLYSIRERFYSLFSGR